jgi:predicted DNA-binding transcriptional regulator AlpA
METSGQRAQAGLDTDSVGASDAFVDVGLQLARILREASDRAVDAIVERLRQLDDLRLSGPGTNERLLNLRETAEILRRSERWVRERARTFELPVVRLDGGALAFRPADVEAFINAHRVPAIDQPPPASVRTRSPRYLTTTGAVRSKAPR